MKKRLLSVILALCMIITMTPAAAFATGGGDASTGSEVAENVQLDKTATDLENDQTEVTLTVGATQTTTAADVVFVLDKSTSINVKNEALAMLDELKDYTTDNNLQVNVGVVTFNRVANNEGYNLDLTELNDDSYQEIAGIFAKDLSGGTNIEAGIRAGMAMLEKNTDVLPENKHLVLVTDGVTYLWGTGDNPQTMYVQFEGADNATQIWSSNSTAASVIDKDFFKITQLDYVKSFANPAQWMQDNVELTDVINTYQTNQDTNPERYVSIEKNTKYTSNDAAIYMAGKAWKEAANAGYQLYAFASDKYAKGTDADLNKEGYYPWASAFIGNLDAIGGFSSIFDEDDPNDYSGMFDGVKNTVLYEIMSGYINDVIGDDFYLTDAAGISAGTFELTAGGAKQAASVDSADSNVVNFGSPDESDVYPYVLTYYPNGKASDSREQFDLAINVPVESTKPLKLTYNLTLKNKETASGMYSVPTNEEATLTYTPTIGNETSEEFPVPDVTYTVNDIPVTPPSWDISKSKTATNLDANYESDVTLALPAADYERTMDVVFVIDDTHAGSTIFEDAVNTLLNELAEKDTMDINVGIVAFDAVSRDWLSATSSGKYSGLVDLKDDDALTALETAVSTQLNYDGTGYTMKVGGTNTEWAVDMAQDMLAEGSGEEKYLIMFSDLYGYIYRGDLTIDGTTYSNVPVSKRIGQWDQGSMSMGTQYTTFADAYTNRTASDTTPDGFFRDSSWVNYWSIYGNVSVVPVNTIADKYQVGSGTFSGFEKSLCLTYDNLKEAARTAHVIVVNNSFPIGDAPTARSMVQEMLDRLEKEDGTVKTYRYQTGSADGALSGEAAAGVFDGIREDLVQLVDAGSEVVDVIGKGEDGNGIAYDFDFINDISNLKLTVNGSDLNVESIESQDDATASYGFGKTEAGGYQFVLNYYQNGTATQSGEHFVWKINVPVTKDAPVQLTYSVKLTNPQTSPGTYGKYDADGSENYDGLLTNNSATLYPVDSNGEDGMEEVFAQPTVSYEVTGPIEISPADITIYMGGAGYEGTVNESGELGDDGQIISENGFPEPGFIITLPETLKDIDIDDLQLQYKDGETEYNWKFEMYGPGEHEVYRIVPSEGTAKRPVRMQFTKTVDSEEITIDKDEFTFEENLNETLTMKVYGEGIEEEKVRFIYNGKEYPITVGEGELTVRGTTGNVQYGQLNQEINESDPGLSAPEDTLYYINGSAVQVETAGENKADIALLFDDIIENGSGEENTQLLQDRADEVLKESDVLTGSGTRHYESKYLDLVDTNNGNAWLSSSEPVTVYWPLPDNTTENTKFEILHFTGMHREMGTDYIADAIENCVIETVEIKEVTDSHIVFDVDPLEMNEEGNITSGGFSPFMLIWETEESSGGGGGGSSTPELNKEDHFAYIIGYPVDYRTGEATEDKSLWPVKPQNNITRAEVATIFFRMLTDESRSEYWKQSNSYSDVDGEAWYNNAVSTLSNAGILTGYEDGSFRPNDPISRAEFATISARFSDVEFDGSNNFSDVPDSYWAAKYIALAEYLGWIDGYPDGTFKPDQNITRAESMKLVNEVLDRTPDADQMLDEMIKWPDNDENAWYYADVQEATNSHEYQRKDSNSSEKWTSILEVRDWAELERQWSDANSSENPGNVMR